MYLPKLSGMIRRGVAAAPFANLVKILLPIKFTMFHRLHSAEIPAKSGFAVAALWLFSPAAAQISLNEVSSAAWERAVHHTSAGASALGSGPHWFENQFSTGPWWSSGTLPFKFGAGAQDDLLEDAMKHRTPTLYLRGSFQVSNNQANSADAFSLTVSSIDGFVVYINGKEAARRCAGPPGAFVFHDQTSFLARGITTETIAIGMASQWLQSGQNLIAVIAMNDTIDNEGLYDGHDPELHEFRFTTTLAVAGSSLASSNWKYFPGICEPSGGLLDPTDFAAPLPAPEFLDWVEIKNASAAPVSLAGWSLSDDATQPRKWMFPAAASVSGQGFLVVACSGRNITQPAPGGYLHANFSLGDNGEFVGLFDASGALRSHFSQMPPQEARYTWGTPNTGGAAQFLAQATPGAANAAAAFANRAATPQTPVESGHHAANLIAPYSTATPGATLRCTVDGSDPTEASAIVPAAGLPVFPALPGGSGQLLRELFVNQPGGTSLGSINFNAAPTKAFLQASAAC
jgi:hypothetical protein